MYLNCRIPYRQAKYIFVVTEGQKDLPVVSPTALLSSPAPTKTGDIRAATTVTLGNLLRRNLDRLPFSEVIRSTNVTALPDLHADYESFMATLRDHGLTDTAERWTGGNTALVLLGDIFDRGQGAFQILNKLQEFRQQGANITILCGNHEDMMLRSLFTEDSRAVSVWFRSGGKDTLRAAGIEDENTQKFLAQNREQLQFLESTVLLQQLDDVLYMHAELSDQAVALIEKYGIDEINKQWQMAIKLAFQGDASSLVAKSDEFHSLMWSRAASIPGDSTPVQAFSLSDITRLNTVLKNLGINMVIHGHEPQRGDIKSYRLGDIEIMNIDTALSRGMQYQPPNSRGLTITQKGERKLKS